MTVESRRAAIDDLPDILALYAQLNPADLLPSVASAAETWQAILSSKMISVHVVTCDGMVVATCKLIVVPNLTRNQRPFAIIENVVSAEAMRGRGFGRKVVQAAITYAWAAGCYKVMLMTGRTDPQVLAFYESCGFQRGKTAFQVRRPDSL